MDISTRLSFPYVMEAQAQKHVTVNETVRALDALLHLSVHSRSVSAEPANPADGDAYILPVGKTGAAWDGFADHAVAAYQDNAWAAFPAIVGLTAFIADEGRHAVWDGAAWRALSADEAARFGVNASPDDTNRLSVKSDAVLFSHDDVTPGTGDIRQVLNKAAASDAASLLFQTGFSARAELGLTGSDDFALKVSADGVTFHDAIVIDRTTGAVSFPNTPSFSGPAPTVRELLDAYQPASALPNTVILEKKRTDYPEFAVYLPITADGISWCRHHFTNRLFPGNTGAPVLTYGSLAQLYARTVSPAPAANNGTGILATTAANAYATTDAASRAASFTAPGPVGGVSDVSYTTVTGDAVSYSVTVPAGGRVLLRSYNNSVIGGIAAVVIRDDQGTEIPAAQYDCVEVAGEHLANMTSMQSGTGLIYIPLATLSAAGTYTVELTRHASSQTDGRFHDGGLEVHAGITFDDEGVHAIGFPYTSPGGTDTLNLGFPGSVVVYRIDNATDIQWSWYRTTVAGKVAFTLYDAAGATVSGLDTAEQDLYGGGGDQTVTIASGLPRGTYYLHVRSLPDKNPSSSSYRVYAGPAVGTDKDTAGVPGTDGFDDLSFPSSLSANNPGQHILLGPGNLEYAAEWRPVGSNPGDEEFVGGVHNTHESNVAVGDLSVTVDGVAADFSALGIGETLQGAVIEVTFTTTLDLPSTGTPFATLEYRFRFSREGYQPTLTRTLTADAIVHNDYALMLQVPNGTNGDDRSASAGGPLVNFRGEGMDPAVLDQGDGSTLSIDARNTAFIGFSGDYAVYGALDNADAILTQYAGSTYQTGAAWTTLRDIETGQSKCYCRLFPGDLTNGVQLSAGDVSVTAKTYRVFKGTGFAALLDG